MYQHHQDSLQNMIDYFQNREEVIALIFGGSVAKGLEREDSDLDAMVIVTPEYYQQRKAENKLAECIYGHSTYEKGYFDVKYYTKDFLEVAAEQGSEPARNAYIKSRVLFSKDPEIESLVAAIPVFQIQEKEEKMLAFFSSLSMNYHYFWSLRHESTYLKVRTATEIVYCVYRMILQENEILFPCNRNLERAVQEANKKPDHVIEFADAFLTRLDQESADAFYNVFVDWTSFVIPEDFAVMQSKYVDYYELWWKDPQPFLNEW